MANRVSTWGRIWFAAVAVVVIVGFVLQFYLLFTGGSDANSGEAGSTVPLGIRFVRLFSFFTVQSNLLVLVAAVLLAARGTLGRVGRVVYLDALLGIVVTGAAFSFILDPNLELRGEAAVVTALFHNVSPVLMVLGWLLWGPRRQWTWRTIAWAFVWPVAWLAGTFIRGAITGWYPYAFLDVGRVGFGAALTGAAIVIAFALLLTVVVAAVDRRLPRIPDRRRAAGAAPLAPEEDDEGSARERETHPAEHDSGGRLPSPALTTSGDLPPRGVSQAERGDRPQHGHQPQPGDSADQRGGGPSVPTGGLEGHFGDGR